MARISIVIPVYHGWSALNKCLHCLALSKYSDFRVIVVDHSPEPTEIAKNQEGPDSLQVEIIKASSDLWWAGATNIGIRKALKYPDTDFVMLLNDDCCLDQQAISILVEQFDDEENKIVAPVQVDARSDKILVRTAYTAYWLGFPTIVPPMFRERGHHPALQRTGLITGGRGVLIPRQVFESVGLLDEEALPHYGADNDFFLRCKSAGYSLMVSNLARIYIDTTKTTIASRVGDMTFKQFLATLRDRRSHRNIPDLLAHFKKQYPIPGLYFIGVFLNLSRYLLIYLLFRSTNIVVGLFVPKKN